MMRDSLGNSTKYFEISRVNELSGQDLNNFNSVVIVNKPSFSQNESIKLKEYVENGGGVIIYPGSTASVDNYNNTLLKELGVPYINSAFGNDNNTYKFDKIDFEHPVFEGIFKQTTGEQKLNVESPQIKSGWNISDGENSTALVTMTGEKNFLVEYSKGKGRLLMFAVSPDMNNSDYAAKNLFSPITVRSILYLANINSIKPAVTGNDYFIDLNRFENLADTIGISSLQNTAVIEIPNKQSLLNLNKYTNFTSLYNLSSNNNPVYEFAANFNKIESLPAKLNDKQITEYLTEKLSLAANVISAKETVSASVLELRTGKEIWQYFLILALFFLALEYFIAKSITWKSKRENKK
jgi:hypothetical protein